MDEKDLEQYFDKLLDNPEEFKKVTSTFLDGFKKVGFAPSLNQKETIEEIANYYRTLIRLVIGDKKYKTVRININDIRTIVIDNRIYRTDDIFTHDDAEATGCFCAIDCLLADLDPYERKQSEIITKVEALLNS